MPAQSWLYTCAVPVSVQCANAHLPAFGQDLVLVKTAFILVVAKFSTRVASWVDLEYSLNPIHQIARSMFQGAPAMYMIQSDEFDEY